MTIELLNRTVSADTLVTAGLIFVLTGMFVKPGVTSKTGKETPPNTKYDSMSTKEIIQEIKDELERQSDEIRTHLKLLGVNTVADLHNPAQILKIAREISAFFRVKTMKQQILNRIDR